MLCTVEVRGTCSITKEKKETGYKSYHPFEGLKKSKKTGWAVEVAEDARIEVPRVLFLGICLDFHYSLTGVVFPKIGFYFSRRAVAQALVEP